MSRAHSTACPEAAVEVGREASLEALAEVRERSVGKGIGAGLRGTAGLAHPVGLGKPSGPQTTDPCGRGQAQLEQG